MVRKKAVPSEDITVLDLVVGSGHMFIDTFVLLHTIYEEGYVPRDIPVLKLDA